VFYPVFQNLFLPVTDICHTKQQDCDVWNEAGYALMQYEKGRKGSQ